jgi:hypothetical protein
MSFRLGKINYYPEDPRLTNLINHLLKNKDKCKCWMGLQGIYIQLGNDTWAFEAVHEIASWTYYWDHPEPDGEYNSLDCTASSSKVVPNWKAQYALKEWIEEVRAKEASADTEWLDKYKL